MMLSFDKFHGAGNDFIIIDNRGGQFPNNDSSLVEFLCNRRFGIGADGLMLLMNDSQCDFAMRYYNSDGKEGTLCGNGSRCIVAYAFYKNIIKQKNVCFRAYDGMHHAEVINITEGLFSIKVELHDVSNIEVGYDYCFLNTGSPHYVDFRENIDEVDVYCEGRLIRYSEQFAPEGTNVNFVMVDRNRLKVRTYERGVEDETWACGTGVTASVLAAVHMKQIPDNGFCEVETRGGLLNVSYKYVGNRFSDIWLGGPAQFVYNGEIAI